MSAENPVPAAVLADDEVPEPHTPARTEEVPVPKAPGPNPIPLSEVPSVEGMDGNTVHGVLLASLDLEEVGLEILQRMNLGRAEAGEHLLKSISFDVSKGEAERWHRSANATLDRIHQQLQSDIELIQRFKGANPESRVGARQHPFARGARCARGEVDCGASHFVASSQPLVRLPSGRWRVLELGLLRAVSKPRR